MILMKSFLDNSCDPGIHFFDTDIQNIDTS